jgi:hypothetical protein
VFRWNIEQLLIETIALQIPKRIGNFSFGGELFPRIYWLVANLGKPKSE